MKKARAPALAFLFRLAASAAAATTPVVADVPAASPVTASPVVVTGAGALGAGDDACALQEGVRPVVAARDQPLREPSVRSESGARPRAIVEPEPVEPEGVVTIAISAVVAGAGHVAAIHDE